MIAAAAKFVPSFVMLMSPARLIGLRLFNISFGRSRLMNKWLRRVLVETLIWRQESGARYNASSRFFDISELQ